MPPLMSTSSAQTTPIQSALLCCAFCITVHLHHQVLVLCFKMYASKEPSIHSMAGVAIRQIVSALFERVSKSTEEASEGAGQGEEQQMPSHTRDAYLLFQV